MKSKFNVVLIFIVGIVLMSPAASSAECVKSGTQSYETIDSAYAEFAICAEKEDFPAARHICERIKDNYCAQLAFRYGQSLVAKKDEKQAAQWLFYAASNGNAQAQKQLGIMFSVGAGVSVNYIKAFTFLSLAQSNGAEGTGDILNMLESKLKPYMKQRAERYKTGLQARQRPELEEIGKFTDVLIFTNAEKAILKKKVILCNLVAEGVKTISQERDRGVHSTESVNAGYELVLGKLKNPPDNIANYVRTLLKKVTVLVYLGKDVEPETFRLYYFAQCVNSAVKDEKPVIELNSIHDVITGLEKCQDEPGVADSTAFGACLKQHVLPYVAKRL